MAGVIFVVLDSAPGFVSRYFTAMVISEGQRLAGKVGGAMARVPLSLSFSVHG